MITHYFEGFEGVEPVDPLEPVEPLELVETVELVEGVDVGFVVFFLAKALALMYPAEVE